jgi:hypothetical protein
VLGVVVQAVKENMRSGFAGDGLDLLIKFALFLGCVEPFKKDRKVIHSLPSRTDWLQVC